MRFTILAYIFLSLSGLRLLEAQPQTRATGIRGKITDQNGRPLPFAGINIPGTAYGTLANSDGAYELTLDPGTYTLHFQHLGFKTEERAVVVEGAIKTLDVSLNEQALTLRELQVGKDTEDPAYTIMRKAISKARYHQLQILSYTASVYARSTALPTKIPALMKKRLKKEGISENVGFVNESITRVDYTPPNSYKQTILSTKNSLDNSTPTPNEFIFASFYNPEVGGTLTPLSPKAFNSYHFEYEGHFEDRGEIVNKIKVTPKSFKQGVFKGSIYIIEDRWAIHSFNLQTIWQGFNIHVKQLFTPLQNVWVPSSQHFDINGSYLGFSGKFTYIVSLQYDNLSIDPKLREEITIVDAKREPERANTRSRDKSLEDVIAKGKQTDTKGFRKLVKQYEKEQRKAARSTISPREVRRDTIIIEPLANKRDTTYWASVRSVPLTATEIVSYRVADSVATARPASNSLTADSSRFKSWHLLTGAQYRYTNQRALTIASPLRSLSFNPVEAFNMDFGITWQKRFENKSRFRSGIQLHYSTGRNRLSPTLKLQFDQKQRSLTLAGGELISPFNETVSLAPQVNSIYYLLLNRNYSRLYQKLFFSAEYRQKEIAEVVDLFVGLETGKRTWLHNLDKRGELLRGNPREPRNDNIPDYLDYPSFFFGSASSPYTVLSLRLDIQPWRRYRLRNGRKIFFNARHPTFAIHYKKGIPLMKKGVNYDFLEAGFRYEPPLFATSTLELSATAGRFITNRSLNFPDFKHFAANQTILQSGDRLSSFRLLPYYTYSTARNYVQAHASYNSSKLFLTQFPIVRLAGLKEYLQGHLLRTPNTPFYTEQVYGLDGILKLFRVEVATHFDRDIYLGMGFRIGTVFNF